MKYIMPIAVIGILLLMTGMIPLSGVGGAMTLGGLFSLPHWPSGSKRHGRRNGGCLAGS